MKFEKGLFGVVVGCVLLLLMSCNKGGTMSVLPSTRFTWSYKGGSYSASQYTAYLYSRGTFLIIGAQGNTLTSFPQCSFSLTSFSIGAYIINSARINSLKYVDNTGDVLEASTGQVNITEYGNDVISGDFSAILQTPTGGSTPLSGSFVNIPVVT